MTKEDPFKALKEAPYDLFVAPRPYSFDLNEDMIKLIRDEFNAEIVASKLAEAIKGKAKGEVKKVAKSFFEELGVSWMKKAMQLSDEYPDRTIEIVKESVDRQGNLFLLFPHLLQRYVEVAYLSSQKFLKVPIVLNNVNTLQYRIPKCALFAAIKEECGDEVANQMTCKDYCLKALETMCRDTEMDDLAIDMLASTAKDGYCEFSVKKL